MRVDQGDGSKRAFDRLSFIAVIYLALPNFIFLGGWIRPMLGWPIMALLVWSLWTMWQKSSDTGLLDDRGLINPFGQGELSGDGSYPVVAVKDSDYKAANNPRSSWITLYNVLLVLVGVVWSCFGGAGHLFHAKTDWIIRGPVLRDLSVASWPVAYGIDEGLPLILRCPLGYYLPSACLSKWCGVVCLVWLALLWTILGVTLFLRLLPLSRVSWRRLSLGLLLVILFSGMDGLIFLLNGKIIAPNYHLEWWSWPYHYASNTTHLLWAPNHALPAWLAGALFMRHWRNPDFLKVLPLLMALLPLWSPFALVGFLPFALLAVYGHYPTQGLPWKVIDILGPILLVAIVGAFFLLDTGGISTVPKVDPSDSFPVLLCQYLLFILLEFLILAVLVFRFCPNTPLLLAIICLVLIPLGNFGPGNDWVSRTSIIPLFVLCWSTLEIVRVRSISEDPVRFCLIGVLLLLGSLTPINELYGAIVQPHWSFDTGKGLVEILRERSSAFPKHYVADLNGVWLERVLKPLTPG